MFTRQRAILRLIENAGGRIERLRLVKLAFLLRCDDANSSTSVYDFVPYRRRPFSFMLYHDLRGLARNGWLHENDYHVEMIAQPAIETAFLDASLLQRIDAVSKGCGSLSTSALVDTIYSEYPWYTVNAEFVRKRRASRPTGSLAVYTVGYEGLTIDALLNLLME